MVTSNAVRSLGLVTIFILISLAINAHVNGWAGWVAFGSMVTVIYIRKNRYEAWKWEVGVMFQHMGERPASDFLKSGCLLGPSWVDIFIMKVAAWMIGGNIIYWAASQWDPLPIPIAVYNCYTLFWSIYLVSVYTVNLMQYRGEVMQISGR